jgi:hypothetical protein
MKTVTARWAPSSICLAATGMALMVAGLYFLLLRPALLPEDIRYMQLSAPLLDAVRLTLELWLKHVFWVMGGFVLSTGVLIVTLAATAFRTHSVSAAAGVMVGGAASIGWMTIVNFIINSNFKWALLAITSLWGVSLALFLMEMRTPHRGASSAASRSKGETDGNATL